MAILRYTINYVEDANPPLVGHSKIVAKVMEDELGGEPLSRKTMEGVVRLIADREGFGKYLDIDQVFRDLVQSGFLTTTIE